MANRSITGDLLTEVRKNSVEYYECVDIDINPGYYITNAPFDINITGQDYSALGTFLNFGDVEENVTFEVANLTITVSGLPAYDDNNEKWVTRILDFDTNPYTNREVKITRVYFDNIQTTQVGHVEIYKGFIDNVGLNFNPTGTSQVEIETKSHWVDFERSNGQYTNSNTHKKRADLHPNKTAYAADEGLEFASAVIKDIEWKE